MSKLNRASLSKNQLGIASKVYKIASCSGTVGYRYRVLIRVKPLNGDDFLAMNLSLRPDLTGFKYQG